MWTLIINFHRVILGYVGYNHRVTSFVTQCLKRDAFKSVEISSSNEPELMHYPRPHQESPTNIAVPLLGRGTPWWSFTSSWKLPQRPSLWGQRETRNTSGWRRPEEKVITAEFPSSSRLDEAINAQRGIATPSSAFQPREGSEEPILLIRVSLSLSHPPRCPLFYSWLVGLRANGHRFRGPAYLGWRFDFRYNDRSYSDHSISSWLISFSIEKIFYHFYRFVKLFLIYSKREKRNRDITFCTNVRERYAFDCKKYFQCQLVSSNLDDRYPYIGSCIFCDSCSCF